MMVILPYFLSHSESEPKLRHLPIRLHHTAILLAFYQVDYEQADLDLVTLTAAILE